jgi:hypothetical protein
VGRDRFYDQADGGMERAWDGIFGQATVGLSTKARMLAW